MRHGPADPPLPPPSPPFHSALVARVTTFCVGATVIGSSGLYFIHNDMAVSGDKLKRDLRRLKVDVVDGLAANELKLEILEKELAELKRR